MAARPSRRQIIFTIRAKVDLNDIWNWNNVNYGKRHADSYLKFLYKNINSLSGAASLLNPVLTHDDLFYLVMRRKPHGHGHLAIYEKFNNEIVILRVFHTAQNWQSDFIEEE